MMTPANAGPDLPRGPSGKVRQGALRGWLISALRAAPQGLTAAELAAQAGMQASAVRMVLWRYREQGYAKSTGTQGEMRWWAGDTPLPPDAGPPTSRRVVKHRAASGVVVPPPSFAPPTVPKLSLSAEQRADVPLGVKFTRCPSPRDTRYQVDGPVVGDSMRDWQRRRAGQ